MPPLQLLGRDPSAAADVVEVDLLELVDELLVVELRHLAAALEGELFGRELVRADTYEIGAHTRAS